MKKIIAILFTLLIFSNNSFSQFKGNDDNKPSIFNKSSNNLILGFINPKNFSMRHSFNVSMLTTGYGNVSLTSYISSMNYKISNKLDVSADVKFQYSPFASSGLGSEYSSSLQKNLSGVYLSRASLNYRISENASINFQYRKYDESDYFGNLNNPFFNKSGYNGFYDSSWR